MSISANSLFHFTSFNNLTSILKSNCLYPHYCFENLLNLNMLVTYPMVSFTDIPIEQVYNHALKYGGNGLGLKKREWGIEKGKRNNQIVNPVFYITEKSHINAMFEKIVRTYFHGNALHLNEKERNIVQLFMAMLGLYKVHEGFELIKGTKDLKSETTNFYDEREWRYLPDVLSERKNEDGFLPINFHPADDFYDDNQFKVTYFDAKNKEIEKHKLEFTTDDIDYIIIENEEKFSETLSIFPAGVSQNIASKIITLQSLKESAVLLSG